MTTESTERWTLLGLELFVAVSAIGGGLALLGGWLSLPTDLLMGSPFTSYDIPALALVIVVGGTALVAAIAVLRHLAWAATASLVAGAVLVGWVIVEVAVIGFSSWL